KGRPGGREATEVTESACASEAACRVVPYGVYDVGRHTGFVVVGMFHNTPAVAGSAITKWGSRPGGRAQRGAAPLVILAVWQPAAAVTGSGPALGGSRCRSSSATGTGGA